MEIKGYKISTFWNFMITSYSSTNFRHWQLVQIYRGIAVGIYATNDSEESQYVWEHSSAQVYQINVLSVFITLFWVYDYVKLKLQQNLHIKFM